MFQTPEVHQENLVSAMPVQKGHIQLQYTQSTCSGYSNFMKISLNRFIVHQVVT